MNDGSCRCEDGYFDSNQTTRISEKAREYNLDIKLPKKYKRKCPKLPAKLFELGTIEISNGDTYEVVEYNRQGATFKKWKKL